MKWLGISGMNKESHLEARRKDLISRGAKVGKGCLLPIKDCPTSGERNPYRFILFYFGKKHSCFILQLPTLKYHCMCWLVATHVHKLPHIVYINYSLRHIITLTNTVLCSPRSEHTWTTVNSRRKGRLSWARWRRRERWWVELCISFTNIPFWCVLLRFLLHHRRFLRLKMLRYTLVHSEMSRCLELTGMIL